MVCIRLSFEHPEQWHACAPCTIFWPVSLISVTTIRKSYKWDHIDVGNLIEARKVPPYKPGPAGGLFLLKGSSSLPLFNLKVFFYRKGIFFFLFAIFLWLGFNNIILVHDICSGVMLWVSVKCRETICIVIDIVQIKLNWTEHLNSSEWKFRLMIFQLQRTAKTCLSLHEKIKEQKTDCCHTALGL